MEFSDVNSIIYLQPMRKESDGALKEDKKEKHNDKISSNEERIHCAKCGGKILKTDNYCMYCGTPTGTKSFSQFRL